VPFWQVFVDEVSFQGFPITGLTSSGQFHAKRDISSDHFRGGDRNFAGWGSRPGLPKQLHQELQWLYRAMRRDAIQYALGAGRQRQAHQDQ
jgi:hypothetical protein